MGSSAREIFRYKTLGCGKKVIAKVSTPEVLVSTPTSYKKVVIAPLMSNVGAFVVIGNSTIVSTPVSSVNAVIVSTPNSITIQGDNLQEIYVGVRVDGDGVSYTYFF
jgi:hypothetical protein